MFSIRKERTAVAILGAALAAPMVRGQDDNPASVSRAPSFGTIRTLDGEPWIGANVTFLHRPHPAIHEPSLIDQIVVRTDEQGRFRTSLLPGCAYTVSAVGDVDEDGRFRRSNIVENVVARTPLILEEVERGQTFAVRVDPHPTWNDQEELTIRLGETVLGPRPARWWRESDDAVLRTDASASGKNRIEAFALGVRVHSSAISGPSADAEGPVLHSIPSRDLHQIVVLSEDGKPIGGAHLVANYKPLENTASPTSDPGGRLNLLRSVDYLKPRILIAPGWAETDVVRATRNGEVRLAAGQTVRGRLTLNGKSVKRAAILIDASMATGSFYESRCVYTDEDGDFVVDGRDARFPYRLTAVLSPAVRAQLVEGPDAPPLSSFVPIHVEDPRSSEQDGPELRLGTIELRSLSATDFRVTAPGGIPSESATLQLIPWIPERALTATRAVHLRPADWNRARKHNALDYPRRALQLQTDRRGRVRLLSHTPDDAASWLSIAQTSSGSASHVFTPENDSPIELSIEPKHRVEIRFESLIGEPVEGCVVSVMEPLEGIAKISRDAEILRRDAPKRVTLATVSDLISLRELPRLRAVSDQQGRATVVVPVLDAVYRMYVRGPSVTGWNQQMQIAVSPNESEPIVVVVPVR